MNRSAERIPARYAILLSLIVMAWGPVVHAPAPAAATATSSPSAGSSFSPTLESTNTQTSTQTDTSGGDRSEPSPAPTGDSTSGTGSTDSGSSTGSGTGSTDSGGSTGSGSTDSGGSTGSGSTSDGTDGTSPGDSTGSNTGDNTTTDDTPTNSGGTGGGTTTDTGTSGNGTNIGGTGDGTNSGGTSPSPAPPAPAPSDSAEPDYPTVVPPSGDHVLTSPTPGAGSGTDEAPDTTPVTSPSGDPGESGPAQPAPEEEKLILVAGSGETPSVLAGSEITAQIEGADGEGTYRLVSGELPPGLVLDPETGKITGTAQQVGKYSFTIEYVSKDQSAVQSYTIRVEEREVDIEVPPLEPARAGELYQPVVLHTEGGVGPFTYKVAGSQLSGTGRDSATLKTAPWGADESIAAAEVLRGSSKLQDAGPLTQSVADSEGGTGAGGAGNQVGNLPAGMRLENGVLTGKPKPEAAGVYTFTIVSTDRYGSTAEQQMTITVLSEGDVVPITSGDSAQLAPPAQLTDEADAGATNKADTGAVVLPLLLGLLVLGGTAGFVILRHRAAAATHR